MNALSIRRLNQIDLKQLRYFLAVADACSFSRAAERIGIAQSQLSRQVAALEDILGHRLFVRAARHVELTDAGTALYQETSALLGRLSQVPERMTQAARGAVGALTIGFTPAASYHPLTPRVMEAVARAQPGLALRFVVESREQLIEGVKDQRIHAGFAPGPVDPLAELDCEPLTGEALAFACHQAHRLADHGVVSLADLAEEPLIICERAFCPGTYDRVMAALRRAGAEPWVAMQAPHPVCAVALAAAGIGACLVPRSLEGLHGHSARFLSIAEDLRTSDLALLVRADEHRAAVKTLRRVALAAARYWPAGAMGPPARACMRV